MEQMRILVVARRSARDQRIQTLNQIRHLVFCAPDGIRRRFQGAYHTTLIKQLCALRPRPSGDPVDHTTLVTLRDLARRVRALDAELSRIRAQLTDLVAAVAPSLLDLHGLGPPGAATLLVAAGGQPPAAPLRSRRGAPMRNSPHLRQLRQDHPASAQPRREPPSQLGAVSDRHLPHVL